VGHLLASTRTSSLTRYAQATVAYSFHGIRKHIGATDEAHFAVHLPELMLCSALCEFSSSASRYAHKSRGSSDKVCLPIVAQTR
jgi:hypothetical protein